MTETTTGPATAEIMARLHSDPALAYQVWQEVGTIVAGADYPAFEVRTLRPEVTLYARLDDSGTVVPGAGLCDRHAGEFRVAPGMGGWRVAAEGEVACRVCGAGDPANDTTVLWCPTCSAPATIYILDQSVRWNQLTIHGGSDGASVVEASASSSACSGVSASTTTR